MRYIESKANDYKIEDKIFIKIPLFGKFTATAEKICDDKVLFIFDQIVTCRQMNAVDTNEGGFKKTELYRWLQWTLLPLFPEDLKRHIQELTIPTVRQMIGYTEDFNEEQEEQLSLMKNIEHRTAMLNNIASWYWLQDAYEIGYGFACLTSNGLVYSRPASCSGGVRPEFWLAKN